MRGALAAWPRPVLNGDVGHILNLRRDLAATALDGGPGLMAATTIRVGREALQALANGAAVGDLLAGSDFPLIVRPLGSHAGTGLEKVDDAAALGAYCRHPARADGR